MPAVEEMIGSEHWTERKAAACLLRRWGKLTPARRQQLLRLPHAAVSHAVDWHPTWKACTSWHPKWKRKLAAEDK